MGQRGCAEKRHWRRGWPSLRQAGPSAEDARQFQHATLEGAEAVRSLRRKAKAKPHRVRIGRFIPTQPRSARVRGDVSGLRCRRLRRPAARLRELRPHRNPGEPAGRDAGVAAWRDVPVLRERLQGRAAVGLEPGSPFGLNLRAFVIYLRSLQGIRLGRPRRVLRAPVRGLLHRQTLR